MKRFYVLLVVWILFFVGCSTKENVEYNKPALFWYQKILYTISNENLDKADEYYTSLQSEHFASPLLKEATLMLAMAHMDEEEYLLAKYYLDEYIKRYADAKEREFAEYLKIKASFLGFKNINRDQKLLRETIKEAKKYEQRYPASRFIPLVDTILTKLYLTQYVLDQSIAKLYERRGKIKASQIYRRKIQNFWIDKKEIFVPTSWYDYIINW